MYYKNTCHRLYTKESFTNLNWSILVVSMPWFGSDVARLMLLNQLVYDHLADMHSVRHTQQNSREQRDCRNNAPWSKLDVSAYLSLPVMAEVAGPGHWCSSFFIPCCTRLHAMFADIFLEHHSVGLIYLIWVILVTLFWTVLLCAMTSSKACVPDLGVLSQKEELILEDWDVTRGIHLAWDVTRWSRWWIAIGFVRPPDMWKFERYWESLFITLKVDDSNRM